jgi:hypothetical protein
MLWLLKLIPGIGGIVTSIENVLNKKADVALEKYKVDGTVSVAAIDADTKIIEARARLAAAMKDDTATKWGRGAIILFTCLWTAGIFWDSTFRELLPPGWTWRVLALPKNLEYMPYGVFAYLFVTAWKK